MTQHSHETTRSDRVAVPLALALWVLVVLALAFGVSQTAAKVVALFG